jgi:hypothetical protein
MRRNYRVASAVLVAGALLSIASAPAPQAESASGECIRGHAYVSVNGSPIGFTQDTCFVPTECPPRGGVGPMSPSVGPIQVGFGATLTAPNSSSNLTCAL